MPQVGNANTSVDSIAPVAPFAGFPPRAVFSLLHRALHQAAGMRRFEAASGGALQLITSKAQLESYIAARTKCLTATPGGCAYTAGLLGVEGAHALEGQLSNLDVLFAAGFRLFGLQHFADNQAGGSAHGTERGGLTPWGEQLVAAMEAKGMVLDVAHSSAAVLQDILRLATRPFLVSHTGATALCAPGDGGQGQRTLSDQQLRDVAAKGGLIGVGYWREVTCGGTVDAIADVIMHVVSVAGPQHAALGSDWDGGVAVPPGLDAAGMAQLTAALVARGLTGDDLRDVMGRNALRVIASALR